jgi:hypothetical protein
VVAPAEPGGVQLVLHLADEPARAFQAASRQIGWPVLSLTTEDCSQDAERLRTKGWCLAGGQSRTEPAKERSIRTRSTTSRPCRGDEP